MMVEKRFQGAPFGTQKSRFDVSGIHPQSKLPGTFTQVNSCTKSMDPLRRKLGPGVYKTEVGGFSKSAVDSRASGPGWARAYEVSRMAALPHLLHKEQWEKKRKIERNLGPGSYNIKDFVEVISEKPVSVCGVCSTKEQRFRYTGTSEVPGPGTYGDGGIPHSALERKAKHSTSTVGMLDAGSSTPRHLPSVGCELGPGTYSTRSFSDELTSKVTSIRGPYDLFTGDRNKPIRTGHLAVPGMANLGPGQYDLKSFADKWDDEHHVKHGKFGTVSQYPTRPSERMHCSSLSQWPRSNTDPGPGSYTARQLSKPQAKDSPPFISSAERFDKRSRKFFTGQNNPVGAGRYDMQRWKEAQHRNGNCSAFNSKVGRKSTKRDSMMLERIQAKNLRPQERLYLTKPQTAQDYIQARRIIYAQQT